MNSSSFTPNEPNLKSLKNKKSTLLSHHHPTKEKKERSNLDFTVLYSWRIMRDMAAVAYSVIGRPD